MPLVELPSVSITGTGLFTPPESVSNAELVASLTEAVLKWNAEHAEEISAGEAVERALPDEEFIVKASGIERRYVMEKSGVLDPARMRPRLETRREDQLGIQAEMSMPAIHEALAQAGREPGDVDAVIVGCSNLQRAYPAVAIEIQDALGAQGWGYDMNVACSSATFSVQAAVDALRNGSANCVVVVNPEITSGHNNFEMRDFHFIFGDACTALVLERTVDATGPEQWEVLGTKLVTEHIAGHLAQLDLGADDVRRFWLHQANLKMNQLIAKGVLGRLPTDDEAPVILDEFANTSSAGSVIAFHRHRDDLAPGDVGVLCSFGAGYSVGSVVVRRR